MPQLIIQGDSNTDDRHISSLEPTSNINNIELKIGLNASKSSQKTRACLYYDLRSLPAGNVITGATLTLMGNANPNFVGGKPATFHRADPWVHAQVTWNEKSTGVAWATAGGDLHTETSPSFSIPDNPAPNAFTAVLVDLLTLCRDAHSNRAGELWIIGKRDDEAVGDHVGRYQASEIGAAPYDVVANKPKLVIDHSAVSKKRSVRRRRTVNVTGVIVI